MRITSIFKALPLAIMVNATAQQSLPLSNLDSVAQKVLRSNIGVAEVKIWTDGQTFRGFAASEKAAFLSVNSENPTIFEIGSVSKLFTGFLLAQAVENGDLSLDQRLGTFAPSDLTLEPRVASLTLRQLVTHTSCLPSLPDSLREQADGPNPYATFNSQDLWDALSALKLSQPAPCDMIYSNWGFATISEVLSRVYRKSFSQLLSERILQPLKMAHTGVALTDLKSHGTAHGHDGVNPAENWTFQAFAGAGGVLSSAADMLAFGRAILDGRTGPLGPAAERFVAPLGTTASGFIGYGVMIRGSKDSPLYFHDGQTAGFRSELTISPKAHEVLVILTSNSQAPVSEIALALEARNFFTSVEAKSVASDVLERYGGIFRINDKLSFTFVTQNGVLYARLTGQSFSPLVSEGADRFALPGVGAIFKFGSGGNSVFDQVVMDQSGTRLTGFRSAEKPPDRALLDDDALRAYVGSYRTTTKNGAELRFLVSSVGGQLAIKLSNQPMFPVFEVPSKPDAFRYDVVNAEVDFHRGSDGAVESLTLLQNGSLVAVKVSN